jgi:hypothetical protein
MKLISCSPRTGVGAVATNALAMPRNAGASDAGSPGRRWQCA